MSKTYSEERSLAQNLYGIRNRDRLRFDMCGGHTYLDWLAFRVYYAGQFCRTDKGTSHGGKTKKWFTKLPYETYYEQAYRLARNIEWYQAARCPILGTVFTVEGKLPKGGTLTSLSIQHNPDGSLAWISNEANALLRDYNAGELHRMADVARDEGNYELGLKLRACARYLVHYEGRAAA